jgi:hypothetical protein
MAPVARVPRQIDFDFAQLLGLDLKIARTQVHPVLGLVGDAAARVGGDDVIGFILIHCGCALVLIFTANYKSYARIIVELFT